MSIRFDGNIANYLSRVASLPNYNSPYTAMGWLKWKVDNAATQSAFSLSPVSAANAFDFFGIAADAWAISSRLDDDEIQSTGGSTSVIDKWIHWVMVRNSVSDIRIYIDLVQDAQATIDITGRVAADICSVGRLSVGGDGFVPLDAEVAFLRIWTTNLTTTELAAERLSRRAVKTASLFGDYPMLTTTSAGEDVSGNANHFTVNGTIATGASEPPLIAGPSLFRGRGFTFFDDEEVNRFEFWPAVTAGAATHERAASINAVGAIETDGFSILERSVSVNATGTIEVSGARVVERTVALDATASISVSGESFTVFESAASLSATASIETSAIFFSVFERAATLTATASIETSGVRIVERSASVTATGTIEVGGEFFSVFSGALQVSATAAIEVAAQFFSVFERTISISAGGNLISTGQRDLLRSASLDAVATVSVSGSIPVAHERAILINAVASIISSGIVISGITFRPRETIRVDSELRMIGVSRENRGFPVSRESRSEH